MNVWIRIIQLIDVLEDDNPTGPCAPSVKQRLDSVLDTVIQFEFALDILADMTPARGDNEPNNDRDDIHDHG